MKKGDIILPPFKIKKTGISCVYKLNYMGGFFYIGSTKCLLMRVTQHLSSHKSKYSFQRFLKTLKFRHLISIEILYANKEVSKIREREKKILSDICRNNPCLNIIRQFDSRLSIKQVLQ